MQHEKLILQKLNSIEVNIKEIKEHMIDVNSIMTEEDYQALVKYRKEKLSNNLISHEQLKEELEL